MWTSPSPSPSAVRVIGIDGPASASVSHPHPQPSAALQTLGEGALARLARQCLDREVDTFPKPGLVSHIDRGAHPDMDAALLHHSAACLEPYFRDFVLAGLADPDMAALRRIGIQAEAAMLLRTGGINTHRGAIFGMGLLLAAAGLRRASGLKLTLGQLVAQRWAVDILDTSAATDSRGVRAQARYGAAGARGQAAAGFPAVYQHGLPALRAGRRLARGNEQDARVHLCFALIATLEDTNLLHRGGQAGLRFAQAQAQAFLRAGSIAAADWPARAGAIHRAFVARNLSPGGGADLLGITLLADQLEHAAGLAAADGHPAQPRQAVRGC